MLEPLVFNPQFPERLGTEGLSELKTAVNFYKKRYDQPDTCGLVSTDIDLLREGHLTLAKQLVVDRFQEALARAGHRPIVSNINITWVKDEEAVRQSFDLTPSHPYVNLHTDYAIAHIKRGDRDRLSLEQPPTGRYVAIFDGLGTRAVRGSLRVPYGSWSHFEIDNTGQTDEEIRALIMAEPKVVIGRRFQFIRGGVGDLDYGSGFTVRDLDPETLNLFSGDCIHFVPPQLSLGRTAVIADIHHPDIVSSANLQLQRWQLAS